jgi:tripartite-type tricarboxylate transporter receptor subunit TctC
MKGRSRADVTQSRRCGASLLLWLTIFILASAFSSSHSYGYPTKPLRIIVPFPAGSGSDLAARIVADFIAEKSGQPVTIESRTGAGGNLGMDAVAKSTPDGYTLAVVAASNIVINPFLYKNLPFDPIAGFTPIAPIAEETLALALSRSVPANSTADFISLARANPGRLNYGSAGVGSISHLSAVQFAQRARIEIVHVPYRGILQAVTDLVAGYIQLIVGPVGPLMGAMSSDRLRVLTVFSAKRLPYLPDVPTAAESGLPNYDLTTWFGLVAPKATPKEIVAMLCGYVQAASNDRVVRKRLADNHLLPMSMSPDEFTELIAKDLAKWKNVVKNAGIQPE